MAERLTIGWDIGGAHVKAARLDGTVATDIVQWACPLWQGLDQLVAVLTAARQRWPDLDAAEHAITMTGEMVDLFADRQAGVAALVDCLVASLAAPGSRVGRLVFYAGDGGWLEPGAARAGWREVASANWLATASLAALRVGTGMLVDIGSTTTDLIPLRDGEVVVARRDDAGRLASGELVYQGVARTPLCALAPRIRFGGETCNVMNEWFATTADVYRLTGELPAHHDLQPSADAGPKTVEATRQRLARMLGRDATDAGAGAWRQLARGWRASQLATLARNLRAVAGRAGLAEAAPLLATGCGHFLVADLARRCRRPVLALEQWLAVAPGQLEAARVGTPSLAVALLRVDRGPVR